MLKLYTHYTNDSYLANSPFDNRGGSRWEGPGGQDPTPPHPFGGPLNLIKREKTLRTCVGKCRVLVLNSYPDPPLSEILYPTLDKPAIRLSDLFKKNRRYNWSIQWL